MKTLTILSFLFIGALLVIVIIFQTIQYNSLKNAINYQNKIIQYQKDSIIDLNIQLGNLTIMPISPDDIILDYEIDDSSNNSIYW